MLRMRMLAACGIVGGLTASCDDDPSRSVALEIQIFPDSVRLVLGDTARLRADVLEDGIAVSAPAVDWSTGGSGAVTVSPTGLVTAVGDGSATVVASFEGVADSADVAVEMLRFAQVRVGGHSCGLNLDGEAWCWGEASKGELGHGQTDTTGIPVPVLGGLQFQSIAPGGQHTCAVSVGGDAYCWGREDALGIGLPDTTSHFLPQLVTGGLTYQSVVAGVNHTCAVTVGGAAYCWGDNIQGSLGIGDEQFNHYGAPEAVLGGLSFTQLSIGELTTCGVTSGGPAYCWGAYNDAGQLGIGISDSNPHATPEPVTGGLAFESVSVGSNHACGLTDQGVAYCWGANGSGELGGTTTETCPGPCSTVPLPVDGGLTFRAIAAGVSFTCGVDTGGQAYCWGGGDVGGGSQSPTAVGSGIDFVSLSAGGVVCGVSSASIAYCWGPNFFGDVGNGETGGGTVAEPTRVFGQG